MRCCCLLPLQSDSDGGSTAGRFRADSLQLEERCGHVMNIEHRTARCVLVWMSLISWLILTDQLICQLTWSGGGHMR